MRNREKRPTYWELRLRRCSSSHCVAAKWELPSRWSRQSEKEERHFSVFAQEEVDLQVAKEEVDLQVVEGTNHEELGLRLGFSPNSFSLFLLQSSTVSCFYFILFINHLSKPNAHTLVSKAWKAYVRRASEAL